MRRPLPRDGRYCAYLRKSRDDRDANGKPMTQEETLRRHRAWLQELTMDYMIEVKHWYEEVVSGEIIDDRPEMQKLLDDLDEGKWDGVLVIEPSRLGRPNTKEQGIICEYLEDAEVFVVTLEQYYDTTDEADMDYLEYGLQKARSDWKTINKIQKRGRIRSAREGNYLYSVPPIGYDRARINNAPTIVPNEMAEYVVQAFKLVAWGKSFREVAFEFERLGLPSRGFEWTYHSIGNMIRNERYKGVQVLNKYKPVKRKRNGKKIRGVMNPESEWVRIKGNWEPLVSEELWEAANVASRCRKPAKKRGTGIRNPLAGLLYCPKCERAMRMLKDTKKVHGNLFRFMHASSRRCKVKSCSYDKMMDALVTELKSRLVDTSVEVSGVDVRERDVQEKRLDALRENLSVVERSLSKLLHRLNHEMITEEEYVESKASLMAEKEDLSEAIRETEIEMSRIVDFETRNVTIHQAIDLLRSDATAEEANKFLRTFIKRIYYTNDGVGLDVHDIKLKIEFI